MSKVIVTHHGKRRLKERAGVGKNNAHSMAARARYHGIGLEDCLPPLSTWLYQKRLRDGAYAKIYGEKVYLFGHDDALITVYSLPEEFRDWQSFVKEESLQRYHKYTKSLHRFDLSEKAPDKVCRLRDLNTIRAVLNRHFKDEGIGFTVEKVLRNGGCYTAIYVSERPEEDYTYYRKIAEWTRNSLKMSVYLRRKDEE